MLVDLAGLSVVVAGCVAVWAATATGNDVAVVGVAVVCVAGVVASVVVAAVPGTLAIGDGIVVPTPVTPMLVVGVVVFVRSFTSVSVVSCETSVSSSSRYASLQFLREGSGIYFPLPLTFVAFD